MAYEPRITKPREIIEAVPGVVPGVIREENIADEAVTSPKIKDETIRSEDIGAGQVKTEDIADGAITPAKLGPGVVIGAVGDGSITTPKLADGAVTEIKLADNSVSAAKIKTGAVRSSELATNSVIASKMADNAIETAKIKDGAVTTPKIANFSVDYDKIASNSINDEKLLANSVTKPKIADGNVSPVKLEAIDTPVDGEAPTYNAAQNKFEWKAPVLPPVTGVFVPRYASGFDWDQTAFPWDGGFYPDFLDLGGIVPVGTKAVVIAFRGVGAPGGSSVLRLEYDEMVCPALEAGICIPANEFKLETSLVPLDSDRKLDMRSSPTPPVNLLATVIGWFV